MKVTDKNQYVFYKREEQALFQDSFCGLQIEYVILRPCMSIGRQPITSVCNAANWLSCQNF